MVLFYGGYGFVWYLCWKEINIMEIKLRETDLALSFVKHWLKDHEIDPIEHGEDWEHFAKILSECCMDYHKFITEWK